MKWIPTSVSKTVARQILLTKKNSPTILFVGGIAGIVTAGVLACRATLALEEVVEKTRNDIYEISELTHLDYRVEGTLKKYGKQEQKKDLAYVYMRSTTQIVKLYGPSIVIGAISIGALTGSHNILTKRNAALTAAYAALEKGFNEYRQRVIDSIGEDKEHDLRYAVVTEKEPDEHGKSVDVKVPAAIGASIYAKFFDEYCSSWEKNPEYNLVFVRCQQNYANDMLKARGHVFLNEIYDSLGIPRTQAGSVVGWVLNEAGDNYIDFGIFDGDKIGVRNFVNGYERSILLDFNVDGVIYDKI